MEILLVPILLAVALGLLVLWLRGNAADESAGFSRATVKPNEGRNGRSSDGESALPKVTIEDDNDLELTKMSLPKLQLMTTDDDEEDESESLAGASIIPIIYDPHANVDVPTASSAFFVVSGIAQTACGLRKRNEDAFLMLTDPLLFGVADGMGGHRGGDVASKLAVESIARGVTRGTKSQASRFEEVPLRAAQLVDAIVEANNAVKSRATDDPRLQDMGTTIVAARFCPHKERVYIAHVGDSRCYLLRDGGLHQLTTDHTVGELHGVNDAPVAKRLVRALGVQKHVEVDLIFGRPRPHDVYLLCSDGLNLVLADTDIRRILVDHHDDPEVAARELIAAVERGGARDNVTVIVARVDPIAKKEAPFGRHALAG